MDDFKKSTNAKRDEDYVALPSGMTSQGLVDIIYAKNTTLDDWELQTDCSSEELGLPDGYRIRDIDTEQYVPAHMYNSLRNAGFTEEQSHGLIKLNMNLLVAAHNNEYCEPLMFGGGSYRLGLLFQSRVDTEDKAASVLRNLLDSFGLKAIQLDPNQINICINDTLVKRPNDAPIEMDMN